MCHTVCLVSVLEKKTRSIQNRLCNLSLSPSASSFFHVRPLQKHICDAGAPFKITAGEMKVKDTRKR